MSSRSHYLDSEQTALEALQESILENDEANRIVNGSADRSIKHWEQEMGPITNEELRTELYCQYQVNAWKDLFKAISL